MNLIAAFVGKGGVGKTTIASAVALRLSERGKTIIVSSDFMPSLKYIFRDSRKNLDVVAISEKEVAEKWKERYGRDVLTVAREIADVDEWIVDHIARSPGVGEEFLLSNIVEIDLSKEYDYVVWDTAASSSTMHLLLLEREFYDHIDRDIKFFVRVKDKFRSKKVFDLLNEWKRLAESVWNHIKNSQFFLVSTPDELSLLQAEEIKEDLESMGIKVRASIYNRCDDACRKELHMKAEVFIPEFRGSASSIVNKIAEYLPESFIERLAKVVN
ncbi:MAG: ArsA family ATPase [Caldisphaeraceae archaeon]|nr:ArsA family ATPase [Caldisphaeraceae archaeon]MEB3692028.1 ArsA family ATPase [Caldisphaeraceae archaeon]MEB3797388.1 ArsA family ATPase [Caldisphaeraceae archaeon]